MFTLSTVSEYQLWSFILNSLLRVREFTVGKARCTSTYLLTLLKEQSNEDLVKLSFYCCKQAYNRSEAYTKGTVSQVLFELILYFAASLNNFSLKIVIFPP